MSLKNKLFREMFKLSSAAAQQASMKAPSHKLRCQTQPNPPKTEKSRPNPTHGSTQPDCDASVKRWPIFNLFHRKPGHTEMSICWIGNLSGQRSDPTAVGN